MSDRVDPDQMPCSVVSDLWVFTICSGLSVPILNYHIYPKYWDTFMPYQSPNNSTSILLTVEMHKDRLMSDRVDPEQMPCSVVSDLRVFTICSGLSVPILRVISYYSIYHIYSVFHFFWPSQHC